MTYDALRTRFDREHIYIVELELDYCSLEFGVAPCTATGSGDAKCFNTFATTDDPINYRPSQSIDSGLQDIDFTFVSSQWRFLRAAGSFLADGFIVGDVIKVEGYSAATGTTDQLFTIDSVGANFIYVEDPVKPVSFELGTGDERITLVSKKIYRFCEQRSPHPIGIDAIPCLKNVDITPSKIDVGGGMGERSSVSLEFADFPHSDIDIDKYVDERTWIASDRGTFWPKFRSRNPNYQFRALRVLTGYLENGEYKQANFKTRSYIIDKMDVSGGRCRITGKDPLKKASAKKAQVPTPSTGELINDLLTDVLSMPYNIVLGAGDGAQYSSSGELIIGAEIFTFTQTPTDTLRLDTRAERNTLAANHKADDIVQECYAKTDEVNIIARDLLVNFANIDASFINDAAWQEQVDEHLNGNLSGIITKPMDVEKVLKELAEAKPHFIYWDELGQEIKFTALQAPTETANVFGMDDSLVADTVTVKDDISKRVSTVYVNFGQVNPTKPLTEVENYTASYVRTDVDSITKYGSNVVKTINSRWISQSGKADAIRLAQLIGQRFSDIPREITFGLDPKDGELLIGQKAAINYRDMTDATGQPADTIFQILSAKEDDIFRYKGLEFTYGESLPGDVEVGKDTVYISSNQKNINLLTYWENQIGESATAITKAKIIVDPGVVVGSTSTAADGMDTGTWPVGATLEVVNYGHIVGAGGDGGDASPQALSNGLPGGDAINLSNDTTIKNFGVIGGGGGGAGGQNFPNGGNGGGGGAGDTPGAGGAARLVGDDGTLDFGGTFLWDGGNLGVDGQDGLIATGGAAGKAIDKNAFTLTYTGNAALGDVS